MDIAIPRGKYADFSVTEYRDRVNRAQALMAQKGYDALFFSQPEIVAYFTGYKSWLGKVSKHRSFVTIIAREGDPVLFLPPIERGDGEGFAWVSDLRLWTDGDYLSTWERGLRDLGLASGTIAAELGPDMQIGMSVNDWEDFRRRFPTATFVDASALLWQVRMIKSPREIEYIGRACQALDRAVETAWSVLRPGMTERELARALGKAMIEHGADYPGFLVVRSGADGGYLLNKLATDRVIEQGDLVSFDVGCVYKDYNSDTIRMASLGKPRAEIVAIHEVAMRVNKVVREAVRPGVTIEALDRVRRDAIQAAGVDPSWDGIGHSIGISTHELPRFGPGEETPLAPGMVFSVEPGVLGLDGQLFVVEDIVAVTADGRKDLTHSRREIVVVEGRP